MARTQAETIAGLRDRIRVLKGEVEELTEANENLTETLQSIYDAAGESIGEEEIIEGEPDDEDFDPDLDD